MFINNKYTKWYLQIIKKHQLSSPEGYCERHHILPSSLGGTNDPENVVNLSSKAHLICHMLLTKMVEGHQRDKMVRAFNMTAHAMNSYQMRYRPKARSYARLKEELSLLRSEHNRELWKDPEFRAKMWDDDRRVRHSKVVSDRIERTKEAHSARTVAMWQDPDYRAKVSAARRAAKTTRCEVKGVTYRSVRAAAKFHGCSGYMLRKDPTFKILA